MSHQTISECVTNTSETTLAPVLEDQNELAFTPGKLTRSISVVHVDDRSASANAARISFTKDVNDYESEEREERELQKKNEEDIRLYMSMCPPLTRTFECDPSGSCQNECCVPISENAYSNAEECSMCATASDKAKMAIYHYYTTKEMNFFTPRPKCYIKEHDIFYAENN